MASGPANAVYGSRDRRDHINRRISKESQHGEVVLGGAYETRRTACRHDDIDYIPRYQGMSAEEVNAAIMPLLRAQAREEEMEEWEAELRGGVTPCYNVEELLQRLRAVRVGHEGYCMSCTIELTKGQIQFSHTEISGVDNNINLSREQHCDANASNHLVFLSSHSLLTLARIRSKIASLLRF